MRHPWRAAIRRVSREVGSSPEVQEILRNSAEHIPAVYAGVERKTVAAAVGDCHLLDDITPSGWPRPTERSTVFSDDDLEIRSATCSCGRLYLVVWRRVPRSSFEYLIPLTASELSQVKSSISRASQDDYTGKWIAAESAVTTLAESRPTIEYSLDPPEILRWCPPGEPFAFKFSPF